MTRSVFCLVLAIGGCAATDDGGELGKVMQLRDPGYLLYVPTSYEAGTDWPLIVVCHGAGLFDSQRAMINDWKSQAESKRFLLAAPKLRGVNVGLSPQVTEQLRRQRTDEDVILRCVGDVRDGYSVGRDRVFVLGRGGGAVAALYTGLANPKMFRAVAAIEPRFRPEYIAPVADQIDPFQPVLVTYPLNERIVGGHGGECADWLGQQGAAITEFKAVGSSDQLADDAYRFFERVVRGVRWLQIRAFPEGGDDAMTLRFKIWADFEPQRFLWTFGDGGTSPVAEPLHTFAEPGEYVIQLDAQTESGETVRRATRLSVPQRRLDTTVHE